MGFEFGNAFDFNEAAEVKACGGNDNACGLVFSEKFGVDLVNCAPVFRGRRVDAAEHDLVAGDARGFQDPVDVI